MAAAGVAVDLGRVSVEQNRLQNAVDSAALAGSLQLPDDPDVSTGKVATAATPRTASTVTMTSPNTRSTVMISSP